MSLSMDVHEVSIRINGTQIYGDLAINPGVRSIVIFAHGSGSSRHSVRNKYVAEVLNDAGIATLLTDLLTPAEELIDEQTLQLRFDIGLLSSRLLAATDWVHEWPATSKLAIGYFGASTGAAAALMAAAKRRDLIEAVVSRGGRPDLAGSWLMGVHAPTLLIVGECDEVVIDVNKAAAAELQTDYRIEIVPGATHLFEEAGALERVAALARDWFEDYLIAMNRTTSMSSELPF